MAECRRARGFTPGFTMVEMAIVLIIIGLIAVFVMPPLVSSIRQGKIREAKAGLESLRGQIVGYALDHKRLPPDLAVFGSPRDPFGRPYRYLANPASSEYNPQAAELCDTSTNTLAAGYVGSPVLRILDQTGSTIDFVAFVIASDGPDHEPDLNLDQPVTLPFSHPLPIAGWEKDVDLSSTDDDLVQIATLLELKALLNCGMTASAPPPPPPPPVGPAQQYLEMEDAPDDSPGTIYGYGEDAQEGYEGTTHQGVKLGDGSGGTPNTLASRIEANWLSEDGFNLEIKSTAGSLHNPLNGGNRVYHSEQNNHEYLRDHKDEALPFDLSFNMGTANQLTWTVGGRSLSLVIPPPASGKIRVLGNFWLSAVVNSNSREVTVNVTDINNYPLPEPTMLVAPTHGGQRVHAFLSQRIQAVDNFHAQGDVMIHWQGNSYPKQENGLSFNFEIHDIPLP